MPLTTAELLRPHDLEDVEKTGRLTPTDRDALRTVSTWVADFVACPHRDLGREGTVCPFVPTSLERETLYLSPEHAAGWDSTDMAEVMGDYKRLLLEMAPRGSTDAIYTTIIVVFPDLSAERAKVLFADVLGQLAESSYREDGVLFGPFYEGHEGSAIYNQDFRPFQSPVPFLFVRHTVVSDWKFLLGSETLLDAWSRIFGADGAVALAEELRRLPWRDQPARA